MPRKADKFISSTGISTSLFIVCIKHSKNIAKLVEYA
jgi:hypothetical protein